MHAHCLNTRARTHKFTQYHTHPPTHRDQYTGRQLAWLNFQSRQVLPGGNVCLTHTLRHHLETVTNEQPDCSVWYSQYFALETWNSAFFRAVLSCYQINWKSIQHILRRTKRLQIGNKSAGQQIIWVDRGTSFKSGTVSRAQKARTGRRAERSGWAGCADGEACQYTQTPALNTFQTLACTQLCNSV